MADSIQGLPFGLKNGRLVPIEAVPRGLACGCLCPACGERLVAKKGVRQAHHFAHYRGGSCALALETTLHLKAKEIFERVRQLAVPPVYLHRQAEHLFPARLLRFRRVRTEQHLGQVVPDIILENGEKDQLVVEIAVTHRSGEEKVRQLKRKGLSAIELDALAIYCGLIREEGQFLPASFQRELVHGLAHKSWLFNAKQQRIEYKLRMQSALRPVRYRLYKGYHNYLVPGCPLGKRYIRNGFREGKSYARLWQDCLHCNRCFEIVYKKAIAGFREVPQYPQAVRCWGHLPVPRGYWAGTY